MQVNGVVVVAGPLGSISKLQIYCQSWQLPDSIGVARSRKTCLVQFTPWPSPSPSTLATICWLSLGSWASCCFSPSLSSFSRCPITCQCPNTSRYLIIAHFHWTCCSFLSHPIIFQSYSIAHCIQPPTWNRARRHRWATNFALKVASIPLDRQCQFPALTLLTFEHWQHTLSECSLQFGRSDFFDGRFRGIEQLAFPGMGPYQQHGRQVCACGYRVAIARCTMLSVSCILGFG